MNDPGHPPSPSREALLFVPFSEAAGGAPRGGVPSLGQLVSAVEQRLADAVRCGSDVHRAASRAFAFVAATSEACGLDHRDVAVRAVIAAWRGARVAGGIRALSLVLQAAERSFGEPARPPADSAARSA